MRHIIHGVCNINDTHCGAHAQARELTYLKYLNKLLCGQRIARSSSRERCRGRSRRGIRNWSRSRESSRER